MVLREHVLNLATMGPDGVAVTWQFIDGFSERWVTELSPSWSLSTVLPPRAAQLGAALITRIFTSCLVAMSTLSLQLGVG